MRAPDKGSQVVRLFRPMLQRNMFFVMLPDFTMTARLTVICDRLILRGPKMCIVVCCGLTGCSCNRLY
jgi:hypothetical protein